MTGHARPSREAHLSVFWDETTHRLISIVAEDGGRWKAWTRWGDTFEPVGNGMSFATRSDALDAIYQSEDAP